MSLGEARHVEAWSVAFTRNGPGGNGRLGVGKN